MALNTFTAVGCSKGMGLWFEDIEGCSFVHIPECQACSSKAGSLTAQ
jgi:hypothetical protein